MMQEIISKSEENHIQMIQAQAEASHQEAQGFTYQQAVDPRFQTNNPYLHQKIYHSMQNIGPNNLFIEGLSQLGNLNQNFQNNFQQQLQHQQQQHSGKQISQQQHLKQKCQQQQLMKLELDSQIAQQQLHEMANVLDYRDGQALGFKENEKYIDSKTKTIIIQELVNRSASLNNNNQIKQHMIKPQTQSTNPFENSNNLQKYYRDVQNAVFKNLLEELKRLVAFMREWKKLDHLKESFDKENEQTFLHYAAQKNFHEVLEVLIDAGLNVNAKDNEQQTCLDIAIARGFAELADILEYHFKVEVMWKNRNCLLKLYLSKEKTPFKNLSLGIFREIIKYA
ncbi:ankyrin repeat [Stylonychia lemnae]|uniref:Ankyrin repeat n=1 Tax=Stylonychia lemnae TaxID=5949 RepID=A0A078AGI3_STYLE|nr:ankyrin repeat [Stylonychia lemnae]|eukprot:CDW81344.1 ankyrin repeat [Stylonychia lemnae]